MKVVKEYPPNFEQIKERFNPGPHVVFTYGDTIYSPDGVNLPQHLLVHEGVHGKQQTDPQAWWDRVIADPEFRLEQELEAYRAQYKYICDHYKNRQDRFNFLTQIAGHLSSEMYGNCISYHGAMTKIKHGIS